MDMNNYRRVTPLKKKQRKITAPAALVLCLICLIIGVLCGRATSSSNKKLEEAQQQILQLQEETDRIQKLEETYQAEINDLNAKLAEANKTISDIENAEPVVEEEPETNKEEDKATASKDEEEPVNTQSKGTLRKIIIIVLVVVIIACVIFGASLFLRKNDDYDDEDDDEDDEEYEDDYDEEDYDEEESDYDEEEDEDSEEV